MDVRALPRTNAQYAHTHTSTHTQLGNEKTGYSVASDQTCRKWTFRHILSPRSYKTCRMVTKRAATALFLIHGQCCLTVTVPYIRTYCLSRCTCVHALFLFFVFVFCVQVFSIPWLGGTTTRRTTPVSVSSVPLLARLRCYHRHAAIRGDQSTLSYGVKDQWLYLSSHLMTIANSEPGRVSDIHSFETCVSTFVSPGYLFPFSLCLIVAFCPD